MTKILRAEILADYNAVVRLNWNNFSFSRNNQIEQWWKLLDVKLKQSPFDAEIKDDIEQIYASMPRDWMNSIDIQAIESYHMPELFAWIDEIEKGYREKECQKDREQIEQLKNYLNTNWINRDEDDYEDTLEEEGPVILATRLLEEYKQFQTYQQKCRANDLAVLEQAIRDDWKSEKYLDILEEEGAINAAISILKDVNQQEKEIRTKPVGYHKVIEILEKIVLPEIRKDFELDKVEINRIKSRAAAKIEDGILWIQNLIKHKEQKSGIVHAISTKEI